MNPTADQVRAELSRIRDTARRTPPAALRDGSWLLAVLRDTVQDHADEVAPPPLRTRHPDAETPEALADACIASAQVRASLAGGLSAGAYASVVMATLATGGLVGAALPAAVVAFAVDLLYQARLQVLLAWELSVIYDYPLDPDKDEDLWTLTTVAFGVDHEGALDDVAKPSLPLASRFGTRALTTAARLATGVQAVGRTLALRSVAKFAIPAVGVPLCAGVNHITTGAVGRAARRIFRDRAGARHLGAEVAAACDLTTCAVLLILGADGRLTDAEVALVDTLADLDTSSLAPVQDRLALDEDALVDRISVAPADLRRAVWLAARAAAEVDGEIVAPEQRLLDRLRAACDPD